MFQTKRKNTDILGRVIRQAFLFLLVLAVCNALWPGEAFAAQSPPSVSAKAAALIRADTGELLYGKQENERLAMASTTKIMTALLALEQSAQSNPEITITQEMVAVEGSSMGLRAGYRLTLRDLAAGMLSVSGNDAANAAAIAMAGSKEAFAGRMNAKAAELGMENTHFVTPSGLDDEAHYSTAKDMAVLGAAAIRNPDFLAICSQKQVKVTYLEPEQTVMLGNHNRLLSMYEGCIGVKTGFTKKAGRCLVSAAERDGVQLVAVTLNAPDDWNDHKALLDYGFSLLHEYPVEQTRSEFSVPVVGAQQDTVWVKAKESGRVVLKEGEDSRLQREVELPRFLYGPLTQGQQVGLVRYTLEGETVWETPLLVQEDIAAIPAKKSWLSRLWDTVCRWFGG